jgi:hypothetical protein
MAWNKIILFLLRNKMYDWWIKVLCEVTAYPGLPDDNDNHSFRVNMIFKIYFALEEKH